MSTFAVVSVYASPCPDLLLRSHGTFASCKYFGDCSLAVIDITSIKAVVAMIPHIPPGAGDDDKYFYLVEKPGLDIANLGSSTQEVFDEDF